jgi:hypothetical protein
MLRRPTPSYESTVVRIVEGGASVVSTAIPTAGTNGGTLLPPDGL